MPRTKPRRLVLLALGICTAIAGALGLSAGTVSAHNTLLSSSPADGASLSATPTQITWVFDNPVPLETMTVTLIDASGARSDLAGSVHGPAGDTEVVTPLPTLPPGDVSLRWRLVGPDGHPITGRVDFAITAPVVSTIAVTESTLPAAVVNSPPSTSIPSPAAASAADEGDATYSTPSLLRWILRYGSYLAVMAIVGVLLTSAFVWPGSGTHPLLRRVINAALLLTAVLAFLQLLVIASDISGAAPWSSLSSVDAATATDAGMAIAIRIALAATLWVLLFQYRIVHPDVYWTAVALPGLGLLATWAFAGHARSMRWPAFGVAADIAHHAAAALWITGLAIVGWIVIPRTAPDVLVPTVQRFSRVAALSVGVIVVTGLAQTVRLVGNPINLLDAGHGRYLVAKVVVLGAMLGLANTNRRRADARLRDPAAIEHHRRALRKSVLAEFAIGLVIVAITAVMVVSPPATEGAAIAVSTRHHALLYYIM